MTYYHSFTVTIMGNNLIYTNLNYRTLKKKPKYLKMHV